MCYGWTCLVGDYVLQVCAEDATIYAAVNLGNWSFIFPPQMSCLL